MISFENSLQFWSVAVLLSILLFIFIGGLWVSIQSRMAGNKYNIDDASLSNDCPTLSCADTDPSATEDLQVREEDMPDNQIRYLRRTAPRRLPD